MKKVSIDVYNEYLSTKSDLDFYFSIMFENLDYFTVADDFVVIKKGEKVEVIIDKFSSIEFQTYVYKPFFESLKDKTLVEGETLDTMFEYTFSRTIRAAKDNIYIMLHAGSKELFEGKFEDEIIERINKKAYTLFEGLDNSVDRDIYFAQRWFNSSDSILFVNIHAGNNPRFHYINVTAAAVWEGTYVQDLQKQLTSGTNI